MLKEIEKTESVKNATDFERQYLLFVGKVLKQLFLFRVWRWILGGGSGVHYFRKSST